MNVPQNFRSVTQHTEREKIERYPESRASPWEIVNRNSITRAATASNRLGLACVRQTFSGVLIIFSRGLPNVDANRWQNIDGKFIEDDAAS